MASFVHDSHGRSDRYDHVVIASHSDQALAMLSDADARERAVLGAIGYSPNTVNLHRDASLMPKRRRAWASWNFLRWQREGNADNDAAVTYWMNQLQGIDHDKPLFVSLNPPFEPARELTFRKYTCEHPQYNATAFAAQKRLSEIQGRRHTWFCGAWTGYGFHEDGLRSGLPVALGASVPWRAPPPELAQSRGVANAARCRHDGLRRALFWRSDARAPQAGRPSLQLSGDEPADRSRPARGSRPAIPPVRRQPDGALQFP